MDDLDLPEDLVDVEVVYLDDELGDSDEEHETSEEIPLADNTDEADAEEIVDVSSTTFGRHTKAVFSSALTKDGLLAASGGEDDAAFVWDVQGAVKFECTGHRDSVTNVAFNRTDTLVATADMAGLVQVWKVADGGLAWCYEVDDVEWMLWHPQADVLFAGTQSGEVYLWQVPDTQCKLLASHGAASTSARVLSDGKRIIVGYGDGVVKLWDIKSSSVVWSFADQLAVTSLEVNSDNSIVSLAPSSKVLKLNDGKSLGTLLVDGETEIETQVFFGDLLITGAISGQVCVWDLTRQTVRHHAKIESAVTVLKLTSNGTLIIGSAGGSVYVCDVRSGKLLKELTGHRSDILSICVFPDGNKVLTSSEDGTCKIFNV